MPALPLPTSRTRAPLPEPTVRPLLIRPGARFDCFGDGLCCTDIHALGPVTRAEKKELDLLEPGSLVRHKDLGASVFRTVDHACVHRCDAGCDLHARRGMEAKPLGCSRFPFGLITTPEGGRITTEHRCPCRTMGERPALTVEAARPWLLDPAKRLSSNGKVGPRVALAAGKHVPFARYREWEVTMIDRLIAGEDPFVVLEKKPFGKLDGERWSNTVKKLHEERDGSAYGEAMVWCGNALKAAEKGEKLEMAPRPWAWSFDKSELRGPKVKAELVLGDWLADMVWGLDWVFSTRNFEAGRREMASLYAIALEITNRLVRARVRSDRAAAEAITIVELTRQSQAWEDVQLAL